MTRVIRVVPNRFFVGFNSLFPHLDRFIGISQIEMGRGVGGFQFHRMLIVLNSLFILALEVVRQPDVPIGNVRCFIKDVSHSLLKTRNGQVPLSHACVERSQIVLRLWKPGLQRQRFLKVLEGGWMFSQIHVNQAEFIMDVWIFRV